MPPPASPATGPEESQNAGSDDASEATTAAAAAVVAAAAGAQPNEGTPENETDETESTGAAGGSSADAELDEDQASDVAKDETPVGVPPPPAPLGPDDTGEFAFDAWTQPVEDDNGPRGTAWLVPAGILVAILAAVAFLIFGGGNAPSTTTVAAVNTTIAPVATTSTTATTTTQAPTTTAVVFPLPDDWPPVGEPIDIVDLTLKQSAIGPIDIGMAIGDVAGALTSSLGEASGSGIDGLCPPDESYWLQFGQLTAIFDGFESASVFVSYRYDEPQGTDPELGLETLSGIAIGDTVEDLINTYTQFTISFEIIDSKDHFRLSDGGDLLLWGPLSSSDPAGLIEGIYSPTACNPVP